MIGAGILVGIGLVIVILPTAAGAAAMGGAGAAAAAELDKEEKDQSSKKSGESASPSPSSEPDNQFVSPNVGLIETPTLKSVLEEHVSSFKEHIAESDLLSTSSNIDNPFEEKARNLGAFLAHEALDGISELACFIPQLVEEIKEIGERFLSNPLAPDNDFLTNNPIENYKQLITDGHQKIDQIFSTGQSEYYTSEVDVRNDFAIGLIPPPGLLSADAKAVSIAGRIDITQASNVKGWTVGQPIYNLTKSGNVPKWSTVRNRYWKNEAYMHPERFDEANLERAKNGLAEQRKNPKTGEWESKELHHDPSQKDGGLFDFVELWSDEHDLIHKYKIGK